MSDINMIVAVSNNDVIGKNNVLPWHIAEDLKMFKHLTMDGILFVGKKTAETLPPLKGREVILIDREKMSLPNIYNGSKYRSEWANKKLWIIGGATIYNEALKIDIVDTVFLTRIYKEYDGDTYFPTKQFINGERWVLVDEHIIKHEDPYVILQEFKRNRR